MNISWTRFLKSAYRREPITSVVITAGAVDALIGGLGERGSLLAFGLTSMAIAIALRWWQHQQFQQEIPERVPEHYLPPSSSRAALPMLMPSKKHPPR